MSPWLTGGRNLMMVEVVEDADFRPTPLIRLGRFAPDSSLWGKAEYLHPSGSAFDRIARPILMNAPPGLAVVAGAGSVCLAFCRAAALLGRELAVVCPDSTLPEHLNLIKQHSVQLVKSDAATGLAGAHDGAQEIAHDRGGTVVFSLRVYREATRLFADSLGEEIVYAFERLDPKPELVVAPVAAGAIIGGIGRALARAGHRHELIGTVRPASDSFQDGIALEREVMEDGIERVAVADHDAFATRMALARQEGILVGMGSAAAVRVALERARPAVAILVDAGDRYFSVDRRLRE